MRIGGKDMSMMSVVVPCYNEQEAIPFFMEAIKKVMRKLPEIAFEIIFIDDGSKDNTLPIMRTLEKQYKYVRYISFSRNFGKEAAIYAGLEHVNGDYIAIMDVDLQDPPELIEKMYAKLQEGEYDCIATRRATRKGEPPIRSFFAKLFYKLINMISDTEVVDGARDFRLMTKQMKDSILQLQEYNRFSKGIFSWVGYKTMWLEYDNVERVAGSTKWSFWKLLLYSFEGIMAFSTVPLAMASIFGIIMSVISFICIIVIVAKTLIFGDPVSGWPSMVSIVCLIGGIQLLCMGIIGQYLAKVYTESKKRPIYLVKEDETIRHIREEVSQDEKEQRMYI